MIKSNEKIEKIIRHHEYVIDNYSINHLNVFERIWKNLIEKNKEIFTCSDWIEINNLDIEFSLKNFIKMLPSSVDKFVNAAVYFNEDEEKYLIRLSYFSDKEKNVIYEILIKFINLINLVLDWKPIIENISEIKFPNELEVSESVNMNEEILEFKIDQQDLNKLNKLALEFDASLEVISYLIMMRLVSIYSYSNSVFIGVRRDSLTVPLASSFHSNITIADFIKRYNHENKLLLTICDYLKEEDIVNYLYLERNGSESIYQAQIIYNNDININEIENNLFKFCFNNKAITKSQLDNILRQFKILIHNLHNQDQKIKNISLLDRELTEKILSRYRNGNSHELPNKTLYQIFEENVQRYPERVAVLYDNEKISKSLSYFELNKQIEYLAHYLARSINKNGVVIATYLTPGFHSIIALLAIWKIGCIYMPLDPKAPDLRNKEQLIESSAEFILTCQDLIKTCSEFSINSRCLDMDMILKFYHPANDKEVTHHITINDPAYILYTSGSTGKTKAVLIGQKQIANSLLDLKNQLPVSKEDILLALANSSFDLSILEWILPLISGAACLLTARENATDGESIKNLLEKYQVTILEATPVTWKLLLRAGWTNNRSLKKICGGERLEKSLAKDIAPILHVYGTTETTTWSSYQPMEAISKSFITIGTPAANTSFYLLDQNLELVPEGVIGELYISGQGLGCYLDEQLNNERFIFHESFNEKLYKTGDLFFLSDRQALELIYIGRSDSQIKIRGYRINLNQIEEYIASYEEIDQCAVIPEIDDHNQYLVAYVVPKKFAEFDVDNIHFKSFLRKYLLEYMIPSIFYKLSALPVSNNGKVNRHALKGLFIEKIIHPVNHNIHVVDKLRDFWAKVVGKNSNLITDESDFFYDHGGNSVSAARLVNLINQEFLDVNNWISVAAIYENSVFRKMEKILSDKIDSNYSRNNEDSSVSLEENIKSNGGLIPVTPSQKDMWFIIEKLLANNKAIYNNSLLFELNGQLDKDKVLYAIRCVVAKQEALRTVFICKNENDVYQRIIHFSDISNFEFADFYDLHADDVESFWKIMESIKKKSFDLDKELLFKLSVIFFDNEKSILIFSASHIIFDGYSENIFCNDFAYFYNNFYKKYNPFSIIPVRLIDGLFSKNKQLNNEIIMYKQSTFWKNKLNNYTPLNLPTKNHKPSNLNYLGEKVEFILSADISNKYQKVALENKTSVYTILLAAFKVLLYRYTNQNDISVVIASDGRSEAKLDNLIGHFVNLLIIRDYLSADLSFQEVINNVNHSLQEALSNQFLPYHDMLEIIRNQDIKESEILFVQQPEAKLCLNDIKSERLYIKDGYAKYPLTVNVQTIAQEEIVIEFEYAEKYYTSDFINNMAVHFQTLLNRLVENFEQEIATINYMSEQELQKIKALSTGNTTTVNNSQNIVSLFENVVKEFPKSVAIIANNKEIIYENLNLFTDKLASYLRSLGISPQRPGEEQRIALYFERSPYFYMGMLAVLKAGAAFVPIDASYPHERVLFMLKDSNVTLILSHAPLIKKIKELNANLDDKIKTISIDSSEWFLGIPSVSNSTRSIMPENLAYITYTSGTTGVPKGVMIEHKNLTNYALAVKDVFKINSKSRGIFFSSYGFDASELDWINVFLNGACGVIPPKNSILVGEELYNIIKHYQCNFLFAPPSILKTLPNKKLESLKLIICGGERLSSRLIDKLGNKRRFVHVYGTTETTILTTYAECHPCKEGDNPNIGGPFANMQVFILDGNYQPLPIGVPGELYIAGAGVGRGYTNQSLTENSFLIINHPFEKEREISVYRTGDWFVRLQNGDLIFIGRKDSQLKLRGVRIELSEIETVLKLGTDLVADAVVEVVEDENGKRIVAYVVIQRTLSEFPEDKIIRQLKGLLQAKLLSHMVPSKIILIPNIPLTSSGKVDRRKLATYNSLEVYRLQAVFQTPTQQKLAEIWAEVLPNIAINAITNNSDFFELGGDSIRAVQLIARVKKEFKLSNLNFADLYQSSDLESFAALIEKRQKTPFFAKLIKTQDNDIPPGEEPPREGNNVLKM